MKLQHLHRARHALCTGLVAGVLATAGLLPAAQAQDAYPNKPVRIVIGFAPGSGTDITARMVAQELQKSLNQTFLVENRPGAAVMIAANLIKNAAPDGYSLLLTSNSSHSVNPHVFKKIEYDPITDFTPISGIAALPFLVAVNPDVPAKTLPELVNWARANKGKVFYGYSGSTFHVPSESLNRIGQMGATGVPFKSSPDVMTEVIAGRIQWLVVDLASSKPHVAGGRLRTLAVTSAKRSALAPELPSVEEVLNIKDFDMGAWTGLFGPARLPKDIVDRLSGTLQKILTTAEVKQRMLAANIEAMPLDPVTFDAYVKTQLRSWGQKVRDAGIQPE